RQQSSCPGADRTADDVIDQPCCNHDRCDQEQQCAILGYAKRGARVECIGDPHVRQHFALGAIRHVGRDQLLADAVGDEDEHREHREQHSAARRTGQLILFSPIQSPPPSASPSRSWSLPAVISTASVSAAIESPKPSNTPVQSASPSYHRRMRSSIFKPLRLRRSWTIRTAWRAIPSRRSASVIVVSRASSSPKRSSLTFSSSWTIAATSGANSVVRVSP